MSLWNSLAFSMIQHMLAIWLIIFFAAKNGEALYSQQKEDLGLTVAQIISSLLQHSGSNWRKQGKTTKPFSYDLNQTPYNYIVGMTDIKGLDLVDRVPKELWMEVYNVVKEVMAKTISKKKKCKKTKWLSEEASQIAETRSERQRRKREIYPTECRVPESSKES